MNVSANELINVNQDDYIEALISFQEFYNITPDGKLNEDTAKLMLGNRCGNIDDAAPYSVSFYRWTKSTLKWHFYLKNTRIKQIASRAFNVWAEQANINFVYNPLHPDNKIFKRFLL